VLARLNIGEAFGVRLSFLALSFAETTADEKSNSLARQKRQKRQPHSPARAGLPRDSHAPLYWRSSWSAPVVSSTAHPANSGPDCNVQYSSPKRIGRSPPFFLSDYGHEAQSCTAHLPVRHLPFGGRL